MAKYRIEFIRWIGKQMTLENLECHYPDDIWFLQSELTQHLINQYNTDNLYKLWYKEIYRKTANNSIYNRWIKEEITIMESQQEKVSTPETIVGPTEEEIKDACAEYFLYKPKEHNNTLVAWREAINWYRSQLKSVNLKDFLMDFAKQFYADEETCENNVDYYLSGKGKEAEGESK